MTDLLTSVSRLTSLTSLTSLRVSCLLATLSWDRRLRLYDVQTAQPRLVTEISSQWIRHHAQPPANVRTLEDVRRRCYALSIIGEQAGPVDVGTNEGMNRQ